MVLALGWAVVPFSSFHVGNGESEIMERGIDDLS